jgi:acetylornithine deacetylase/succinyl-diaminopimelate desuccinylase-like protein
VAPEGGLVRHAGAVLDAIETWRDAYLRAHPPTGQLANEIVIGGIRGGSAAKADLIPGLLEVFVYAILVPGADPARVARELEDHLRASVADLPERPSVEVEVYASAPGGSTDPESEIVRLASDAWLAHVGSDPRAVTGWTGATDGAVFRAAGIPTARMGAAVKRDGTDPRIEIVAMDDLLALARAHVEVVVRYFAAAPGGRSAA